MPDEQIIPMSLEISTSLESPETVRKKKLEKLYHRIDKVLNDNRRGEILTMILCTLLFLSGLGLFIAGYVLREPLLIGSGVIVDIGLIWPIRRITELRDENIKLSVLPGMLDLLPPEEAVTEWKKFYKKWFS